MISCSSSDKVDPNTQTAAQSKFVKTTDSLNTRNFPVSIGMTQQQIRELFPISEFKKKDAWSYGVDGGGYGIEVLLNESVLFFFWLHWETELVDGIVLVSPDYHIDENVLHCAKSVRHGAKNLRHGVKNVSHGAENVHHGAKNVRHGAKNVRHGAEYVRHGAGNVSHGT